MIRKRKSFNLYLNYHILVFLFGKVRRFYFSHFKKNYVRKKLINRRGACLQCGACCGFMFTCPFLNRKQLCQLYNITRCKQCELFPIDKRDLSDVGLTGKQCGFRF